MATTPIDQTVREEIRTNLDENLLVEAGAGTGKTTALVSRIVEVLAAGRATADSLVAMTFTEAAAAELSARVREAIERGAVSETDPDRAGRLDEALRSLHRARIETIHAFCASLLHERPVEAGIDPEFGLLADLESDLSFDAAYSDWLDELMEGDHPEVEEAFNLGLGLKMFREAAEVIHRFRYLLPLNEHPRPRGDVAEVEAWLDQNADELDAIANSCTDESDGALAFIGRILDFRERLAVEGTTPAAKARLIATGMPTVKLNRGSAGNYPDGNLPRIKTELFPEWRELEERIPTALRSQALLNLIPHAVEFVTSYAAQRRAEGVADFDDILIWARDLLRNRIEVRRYFQDRFDAILIDEFQDTDPIQAEIAMYLASDGSEVDDWHDLETVPGKLFLVGDPKQSIYRFRRADIGIYDQIKRGQLRGGVREIVQNFRSVAPVLDWVNDIFNRLFVEVEGVQPANVPLVPSAPAQPGRTPIVLIRDSSEEKRSAGEAREREALAVAAVLRDAVEGGEPWRVRDEILRDGTLREATWRDVVILMPARTGLEQYESALAAANIPHRHEGSRDYFQRQEIRDFVLLMASIDDPADKIAAVGALRSSAFGCSDDDLLIHFATGGIWDCRVGKESESERVMEAQKLMLSWHRARGRLSIGEFVIRTLTESRLVEYALTLPDGAQAAANLLAIGDRAREFASAGGGGPRPFIRWLIEHSEREQNEVDTGITEDSDNVVRLMTMHGSKGLEFPIVVLANLANQPRNSAQPVPDEENRLLHFYVGTKNAGRYPTPGYEERWDEEKVLTEAEACRLLYVAATRSRDHLIVPDMAGKPAKGSTLENLRPLLPDGAGHEAELDGTWLLDAESLDLPVPSEAEDARVADDHGIEKAAADRQGWESTLAKASQAARRELSMTVASSVERTTRPLAAEASHSASTLLMSEGPPLEIGDALHLVMERVSLPDGSDLADVAAATCLEAGIPDHEDEVVELARRCLDSPVAREALASNSYQREVPFTTSLDKGYAVGRADLVFARDGELVVVDYKTDFATAGNAAAHAAEHHSHQAEIYRSELGKAVRLPAGPVVFVYCRAGVEVGLGGPT